MKYNQNGYIPNLITQKVILINIKIKNLLTRLIIILQIIVKNYIQIIKLFLKLNLLIILLNPKKDIKIKIKAEKYI